MINKKIIGLAIIGVLLTLALTGSTGAITTKTTVMNGEYVKDTFEKEGVYEEATGGIADTVGQQFESDRTGGNVTVLGGFNLATDSETYVRENLTREYVKGQVDGNVDRMYAYLHGERDTLNLSVNLRPIKADVIMSITNQVDVNATTLAALAEEPDNESAAWAVDSQTVEGLLANQTSYSQTKTEWRNSLPRGVDLDTAASEANSDIASETPQKTANYSQDVTNATMEVQYLTVDALTTNMTYEEYNASVTRAMGNLSDAIDEDIRSWINEEVPNSVSMDDQLGASERDQLASLRAYFGRITLLSWLLPIFSLVLVGVAYLLSRSVEATGKTTGVAATAAGIIGLVPAYLGRGLVISRVQPSPQQEGDLAGKVVIALIDGVFGRQIALSLWLIAIGLICVGLAFALQKGYFDRFRNQDTNPE